MFESLLLLLAACNGGASGVCNYPDVLYKAELAYAHSSACEQNPICACSGDFHTWDKLEKSLHAFLYVLG